VPTLTEKLDKIIHTVQQAMDEFEHLLYSVEKLEKENAQLRGLAFDDDEDQDIVDELRGNSRLEMIEQDGQRAHCEIVPDELSERAANIIERLREENLKLRKAISND
jgi:hypothetical protein